MFFRTITLTLLAIPAIGSTIINETNGTLKGVGKTPTHNFPVNAKTFNIELSESDSPDKTKIVVNVPVLSIDTENDLRNSHMWSGVFAGYEEPGKGYVVYTATTDSPLKPGPIELNGELSILGQNQPVKVTATITDENGSMMATGSADIDLDLWGIETPKMGPIKVNSVVGMSFSIKIPIDSDGS